MKLSGIILTLVGLFLIVLVLPFAGYQVQVADYSYQTLRMRTDSAENANASPSIVVFTEKPAGNVYGLATDDQKFLQSADYSQDLVVIAFYGYGASGEDRILSIRQFKSAVWVRADFKTPPSDGSKTSPYQIISLNKSRLVEYGNLTFRLLTSEYEQKAMVYQNVASPVNAGLTAENQES